MRTSGLPRPGTQTQLLELVSRTMSRPLDRSRPLWEMYLVEGLSGGRIAVITKTHPALVDGLSAIDIGQVLLDVHSHPTDPGPDAWAPRRLPGRLELVRRAMDEYLRQPSSVVDMPRTAVTDLRSTAARLGVTAGGLLRAAQRATFAAPRSPLNAPIGRQRRIAVARADLEDIKRIRKAHGGTVNDVLLHRDRGRAPGVAALPGAGGRE